MNTNSMTQKTYAFGSVSYGAASATNFVSRTIPIYVKRQNTYSTYGYYEASYCYWYPSTGTATYEDTSVSIFNILLKLGKYSSTTGATYKVQGTVYLEGRY